MAEREGVRVSDVVAGGQEEGGDVLLVVIEPDGRRLTELADDELGTAGLDDVWSGLMWLHEASVAHGSIGPETVLLDDDAAFVDLQQASVIATEWEYAADVVSLLGTVAVVADVDRSIEAAIAGCGRDRLLAVLPYIRDAVLEPGLRKQMKDAEVGPDVLRARLVEELGVDAPELASIKRVSWSDVAMVVFGIIAANALISQIASVGFDTIVDELRNASTGWLVTAFVIKVLGYGTAYIGLRWVLTQPLPFAPVALLQSAKSYVGLVLPSLAGRVAMDVRFLQKLGVPTAVALAHGPILSFVGLLVVVAGGVVFFVSPKLRAKVVPPLRAALTSVRVVITSPGRLGRIAFSELLERLVSTFALAATLEAFGIDLPFTAIVFVSVGTGLLAGIAPVPGGVGVAEATMTALLTAVGVPAETAFSVAIIYRLVTSYLPPVFGFFSTNWLTREGYI